MLGVWLDLVPPPPRRATPRRSNANSFCSCVRDAAYKSVVIDHDYAIRLRYSKSCFVEWLLLSVHKYELGGVTLVLKVKGTDFPSPPVPLHFPPFLFSLSVLPFYNLLPSP